jgi:hypothetical protein
MSTAIDRYMEQLTAELRKRGALEARFVEETRGHLTDAVEAGRQRGLSAEDAEREAVARYGDTRTVAAHFAAQKDRTLHWVLLGAAVAVGLAIAWVDSRPKWDDTGITAGMLLLTAGVLGLMGPRRPWLWALGIGVWIPLHQLVQAPTMGNALGGLVILAFPMAGAYAGMAVRRAMGAVVGRAGSR